jgi:ABC-2 type transport system ATP-binding protein
MTVTTVAVVPALRSGATPAIDAAGLLRRFGEVTAVDGIDLQVAAGEVFGLLGPNGAGKTTTIKMLITILPPTAGSARVAGHDVIREPAAVRRAIGYVPQLLSADGALTGRENLDLSARLYHLPGPLRRERIEDALGRMDLEEAADRLVRTYSGGMIRRLELAQAMLHDPVVLFLDEPTVGLDPVARTAVWEHVRRMRTDASDTATTVVLTTHYMEEADALCDRVAVMHRGRIVAVGTPAELKAQVGPAATLDDVFLHLTGSGIEPGGTYRDVARTRRTARRMG